MTKQPSASTAVRGTWDQLKLGPWELTKMVIAGRATIVGKDQYGRNIYELTERIHDRNSTP